MIRLLSLVLVYGVVCCGPGTAAESVASAGPRALRPPARRSPHETVSRVVEGNRVTIVYGRPYTKDPISGRPRKIWGSLVPFDKIWRVGADEATLLITQKPIVLGGLKVPAGAYTLFMLPEANGSTQLLVNKEIGQWGIDPYHPGNELGRVSLEKASLPFNVDQFTITIDDGAEHGGLIRFSWETTQYLVGFSTAADPLEKH